MLYSSLLPSKYVKPFLLSLPVLLMAIGGGWAGDAIGERLGTWPDLFVGFEEWHWWKFGLGLVLFFLGAFWMYCQRHEYLPVRVLKYSSDVPAARVLVMTVSRRNGFEFDDGMRTVIMKDGRTVKLTWRLEEDCVAEGEWNWQQLLRGVRLHKDCLQRIHLIGSKNGSHEQLKDCARFLRSYLGDGCSIQCHDQPVDFEDIDAIREALDQVLRAARNALPGLRDRDIMLDCTGGQKTTSIAVALYTTRHPGLHFQYVNNQGETLLFNVTAEKEPEID